MNAKLNDIKPIPTLAIYMALVVWVSLCLVALLAVINLNLRDAEKSFTEHGEDYVDKLNRGMVSSETVLKGFSALFVAIGNTNPEKVSLYVKSVIDTNNQIFALEIIQKVAKKQLQDFIVSKRLNGNPSFTLKSFSFNGHRGWQHPQDKPFYYPVIYMESLSSGSEEIIGLDVSSVPLLESAVTQAITLRRPVASHPFRLIQGNLAYVVFYPIKSEDNMIVDMIIDADKLQRPGDNLMRDGFTATVHHKDFTAQDPKGQLFSIAGRTRSTLEMAIFPVFKHQKSLATMGEPFSIVMTRQAGWTDLSLGLIGLMALLSLVSSAILYIFLRSVQRGRLRHINHQHMLWKLANHDALTGIPNRMLMLDRLEQALAVSERSEQYGAVIFLDIDNFKGLNDTKGHDAGDLLLIEVAKRIKSCVRDVDTAARLGGDEFVVILSELGVDFAEANAAAMQVADKIRAAVEQSCKLQLFDYRVTVSMGITLFKGNEKTINQLLKSADTAMYQQKATHH